jgi:hypothetical protein
MKIKCGDFEALDSGSVIGFENKPVEMRMDINGEECLFRFVFEEDPENREGRTEFLSLSSKELEIQIINSTSAFGMGTVEPVELGNINGKDLFLSYRIFTSSNSEEKLLHYTWYLK